MCLIKAYHSRDHLLVDIDPLQHDQPSTSVPNHAGLDIQEYGLTLWDLNRVFNVGGFGGKERMALRGALSCLRNVYCLKVGSEYAHILDREEHE